MNLGEFETNKYCMTELLLWMPAYFIVANFVCVLVGVAELVKYICICCSTPFLSAYLHSISVFLVMLCSHFSWHFPCLMILTSFHCICAHHILAHAVAPGLDYQNVLLLEFLFLLYFLSFSPQITAWWFGPTISLGRIVSSFTCILPLMAFNFNSLPFLQMFPLNFQSSDLLGS